MDTSILEGLKQALDLDLLLSKWLHLCIYLMVLEILSQLYFDCPPQRNTLALTVKVSPTFCFMNVPLRLKLDIGSHALVSLHI